MSRSAFGADQRRQLQAQRARIGIRLAQVGLQAQSIELETDRVQWRGVADADTSLQRASRFVIERRRGLQLRASGQRRAQVVVVAQSVQPGLTKRLGEVRPGGSAGGIGGGDAQGRFVTAFDQLVDAQLMVEGFVPEPATPQIPAEVGSTQRQLRVGALCGGERVGARAGERALGCADIGMTRRHPCQQVAHRQTGGAVVGQGRTGCNRSDWGPDQNSHQKIEYGAIQTTHNVGIFLLIKLAKTYQPHGVGCRISLKVARCVCCSLKTTL